MIKRIEKLDTGVYFIYAPNQNKIKIGRSVNIESRYKQLRTGFMDKGSLLIGIITDTEVELESTLHERFSHLRDNGEWFYMTKELDDFVLNCKLEYPNVLVYQDLKEIQNKLSYNSLGLFKLIKSFKNIQNKYLIPIILGLIGLIIAYYNYKFETYRIGNQFTLLISYIYFLFFPLITPVLSRQIIAYQPILVCILYFGLLFITLFLEITNLLLPLNPIVLTVIRIVVLSVYLSLTKNLLLIIKAKQTDEEIHRNVKEELPRTISNKNDLLVVFKHREDSETRIKKIYNIRKVVMQIANLVTYLVLNIYLLFLSKSDWGSRLFIVIISNISVILWFVINLIQKEQKFAQSAMLKKFKQWIIPGCIMIVNYSLIGSAYYRLFWDFISILIIWLFPVSLVLLLTMKNFRKYEIRRGEIDKLLTQYEKK